ncbi:MAG: hypothetical protein HQ527_04345 [Cyanobacteria bacterium]|nr:hypothetical protein [Cyanobacteria bacterium bin.51]
MAAVAPTPEELARYLEQQGAITKPWLLLQLRLSKLKEEKELTGMGGDEYLRRIQDAHQDLMRIGDFWKGREAETFGTRGGSVRPGDG